MVSIYKMDKVQALYSSSFLKINWKKKLPNYILNLQNIQIASFFFQLHRDTRTTTKTAAFARVLSGLLEVLSFKNRSERVG